MNYKKTSLITLLVLLLLTSFFAWRCSFLELDYNFESFFPKGKEETKIFLAHRNRFITDNDNLLIAVRNEKGYFQESFLRKIDSTTNQLKKLEFVEYVISPTNITFPIKDPFLGIVKTVPYVHVKNPTQYPSDSIRITQSEDVYNNYFSEDGKSVLLYIRHNKMLGDSACRVLTTNIKKIIKEQDFDLWHLSGRCDAQGYYVDLMGKELMIFVSVAVLITILFLLIAYRSFWGIWVPTIVIFISVIWTLGIMELSGKSIDIILTILPTIMFVIGLSDAVHLISKYLEELRGGKRKFEALKTAYKEVGVATFLTSFTTAIGFLTLITSGIAPIIDLGIYVALGVLIAFFLTYTLLPSVMALTAPPKAISQSNNKTIWYRWLQNLFLWILKNQKTVLASFVFLIGIGLFGISKIKVNNYLLEDLKEDNILKQGFQYIENHFSGTRPYEVALSLEDTSKSFFDLDHLTQIEKVETFLKREYDVNATASIITLVKIANRAFHGGNNDFYTLPKKEKDLKKIVRDLRKIKNRELLTALITEDERHTRIGARTADMGSLELLKRDEKFIRFMDENLTGIKFHITGTAHLIDLNVRKLSKNILQGLLIAFGVITLIVGFLFRSKWLVFCSLIVNVSPLIFIAGIMGFQGINIKMSTAIIFTIAFGIAVDDTIHFFSKLRHELKQGKSMLYAMKRTFLSTGKAIVVTSLILCGGFLTLTPSEFLGTHYIGLLISLTLFFAVITDLVLLPVLIIIGLKYGKKK